MRIFVLHPLPFLQYSPFTEFCIQSALGVFQIFNVLQMVFNRTLSIYEGKASTCSVLHLRFQSHSIWLPALTSQNISSFVSLLKQLNLYLFQLKMNSSCIHFKSRNERNNFLQRIISQKKTSFSHLNVNLLLYLVCFFLCLSLSHTHTHTHKLKSRLIIW